MPKLLMLGLLALAFAAPSAIAQPFADDTAMPQQGQQAPAPNYANPADWACRPGAEDRCIARLDSVAIDATGHQTPHPFVPAADPPIDCFYVYPTVSREQRDYADLSPGPAVMNTIRSQAGRLASRCRLFAPLYRQATLRHLEERKHDHWAGPYQDVAAAWDWYLQHDNHGRGVILIGHSQGTIILQKLIAERIDGTAAQSRLVAAFLIGNPGLFVPPGRVVGGTFQHVPVCTAANEVGCAYSWSSYRDNADAPRVFGVDRAGLSAACTNPAAPGGSGRLDSYFPAKDIPNAGNAPFTEIDGQIEAACRTDGQGAVLRITVLPGANANAIQAELDRSRIHSVRDWGLHIYDVALAQGSILRLIDAETASWQHAHP